MACPSLSIPSTRVLLPSRLSNTTPSTSSTFTEELAAPAFYSNVNKGGIGVFAVSTDEKRLVVGSRNGECRVVEIVDCGGQDRKGLGVKRGREVALRGHVGDITAISCVSRIQSLRYCTFRLIGPPVSSRRTRSSSLRAPTCLSASSR